MPSFEQNKTNSTWSCRFRIMENGKEKHKRLSGFRTKKDCNTAYIEFMKQYDAQKHIDEGKPTITFEELVIFYKGAVKTNVKESSALALSQRADKLAPYFTNKPINEITTKDVLDFKNKLNSEGYSFKYRKILFACLVNIFNYAVKYFDLKENVAAKEGNFKQSQNDKITTPLRFWEYEQFLLFDKTAKENITCFKDEIYCLMFLGYYLTGARKNELNAIKWSDIDFQKNTIYFNKTATRKNEKNEYRITTPKSKNSTRTTLVPKQYIQLLALLKLKLKQLKEYKDDYFVFGGKAPIPETNINNRFQKIIKLAGLPKIRLHDLRHSHVSYLINICGNDISTIYVIAERIGDRPEEVFKTYGHLFPSKQRQTVEIMEQKTTDFFY